MLRSTLAPLALLLLPCDALSSSAAARLRSAPPTSRSSVVRASADGGRTWRVHRTVWAGSAGYSAMVVLGDGEGAPLGLLYDRNNVSMIVFEARGVTFTTVPV